MTPRRLAAYLAAALLLCAQAAADRAGQGHRGAPLPANAERLSHGRFEDVVVYRPQGVPRAFVLLLSGASGWPGKGPGKAQALAQALAARGALVAGIDTRRFYRVLAQDEGGCEYSSGDLENLSHFVQAYYKLPTYFPPLLAGVGEGAAFAYANLAQAQRGVFAGGLLLDFCPALALRRPLCEGAGYEAVPRRGGQDFLPAKDFSSPLTVVQSAGLRACPSAEARAFVAELPGVRLIALPAGGNAEQRLAQFLDAYDRLALTSRPQELPPPPADLAGLPVVEVPVKPGVAPTDTFAVFMSGDGGWAGLDQEVAGALAAHGVPVVGLDSLRYYWTPRTPQSAAADVDRLLRYYLAHWHARQAILVGYSQGADVLPFILNRLPAPTRARVALAAVLGLSRHALFEFHLGNWVGGNENAGPPTTPEMLKAGAERPLLCIYGADEDDSPCPQLDPKLVRRVQLPGGHHFGGDYEKLAEVILAEVKLTPAAAEAAAARSASSIPQAREEACAMLTLHIMIAPLLALGAGILILIRPKLLNYVIAIYLIAIGVLGLLRWH
jgi:type IV secretory pathway VirJ component